MFDFEDCGKNCFNCENGKTQKDRNKCEYHKKRSNYYKRLSYQAKKKRLVEKLNNGN